MRWLVTSSAHRGGQTAGRWGKLIAGCLLALAATSLQAAQSNRYVGELATESLPADLPQFLRQATTVRDVGEFVREPDRLRGSGTAYDAEHVPDHFFVLDAAGRTRTGIKIGDLPKSREDYIVCLHESKTNLAQEGSLFYAVVESWERLRQDFAYWRVASAAAKVWRDPAQLSWLKEEISRREWLVKRDMGMLGHFAQDATAPLHISIHNEAWRGDPSHNYTTRPFRRYIEGQFILKYVHKEQVRSSMPSLRLCPDPITACLAAAMLETLKEVEPTYQLATQGAFEPGNAEGVAFMARLNGQQAAFTRDLIVKAWRESRARTVNYPPMELKVSDLETGFAPSFAHLHGWD